LAVAVEVLAAGQWRTVLIASEAKARNVCHEVQMAVREELRASIRNVGLRVETHLADNPQPFTPGAYSRLSHFRYWQQTIRSPEFVQSVGDLSQLLSHRWAPETAGFKGWTSLLTRVQDLLSDDCTARDEYNRQFVLEAKARYARFFETVEKRPLTDEQIEAALAFDDLNLTVAAAGSGKTSVIVAKVGFALASGMFRDDDLLVLAFNRDAANELRRRIRDRLSKALQRNVNVAVRTFHSLGNRLLRDSMDEDVRPEKLDGSEGKRRFVAAFDRLCRDDAGFRQKLLDWIVSARYGEPKLDPGGPDVDANEQRYHEACRKAIRSKLGEGRRWYAAHVPTLDPKLRVRSFEEASIANWLIPRHVSFEYERPVFDPIASMMKVPKSRNGK
jgi:UvrD/REP helicase N-terminal domain